MGNVIEIMSSVFNGDDDDNLERPVTLPIHVDDELLEAQSNQSEGEEEEAEGDEYAIDTRGTDEDSSK